VEKLPFIFDGRIGFESGTPSAERRFEGQQQAFCVKEPRSASSSAVAVPARCPLSLITFFAPPAMIIKWKKCWRKCAAQPEFWQA
jgi:hypothetical protein